MLDQPSDQTRLGQYEIHPLAKSYPVMDDEALQALAADIEAHGLKQPIWMFENKVLDGRNRVMAWSMTERGKKAKGVIPAPYIWRFKGSFEDAEQFVFALNMMRRHLTVGQRAMIGLARVTTNHGGDRSDQERNSALGSTYAVVAKEVGVSVDSIKTAAAVHAHADREIVYQVRRGTMSLSAAYNEIRAKAEAVEAEPQNPCAGIFPATPSPTPENEAHLLPAGGDHNPKPDVVVDLGQRRAERKVESKQPNPWSAKQAGGLIARALMLVRDEKGDLPTLIVGLISHVPFDDAVGLNKINDAIVARLQEHERSDALEPDLERDHT
jgi:ParB-like chromosome segregation protein Spo0J